MKYSLALVAVMLGCISAERIPLKHRPLQARNVEAQKLFYQYATEENQQVTGIGPQFPLKDYMNTEYMVHVEVGDPNQWFDVVPDTAHADTWLYGKGCKDDACLRKDLYDEMKSHSSSPGMSNHFEIDYENGKITG